ncbi:invasion associated locus B family protein [Chelativorans composti]|uniref:Invasion associated locus B family protein n=1 Tax=Chelativorans composti TaxID=768533 RepID=A0ABW5DJ46_9HYPH
MRGILSSLVVLSVVATAAPAFAQATAMGKNGAWGIYSYNSSSGKVCYAMSMPTQKLPETLDHGDIFFFISPKAGRPNTFEIQFQTAYNMQQGSKVNLTVDGDKKFVLFTEGKSAWLENVNDEPAVIDAMRRGSEMKVSAVSGRGNPTNYTFSLSGVTASLNAIQNCR